jgi:uncharacterized protein YjbJ (UPF0337 family)
MVNQQVLAGHWNEVRGKLKEKWGKLTDDDLRTFNGNVDQLVGRIQQRTGETREAVERFLGEVADEGSNYISSARDRLQDVAGQVRDRIQEGAGQVADEMRQRYGDLREGYREAERIVQERPGQAMALAFGAGVLAGLGVALLLRDRDRGRAATEQIGRNVLDALTSMLPESLKGGRG